MDLINQEPTAVSQLTCVGQTSQNIHCVLCARENAKSCLPDLAESHGMIIP